MNSELQKPAMAPPLFKPSTALFQPVFLFLFLFLPDQFSAVDF